MRRALGLLVVCLALAGAAPPPAADGPGTKVVHRANETISTLLRKKAAPGSPEEKKLAAQVTSSVRDFLDIEELGRRALVDHLKELTPAQRDRFMSLLRQLIEANYVAALRSHLDYKVRYTGEHPDGDNTVVTTVVAAQRNGHPYEIEVDYVLRAEAGSLRAYDVVTDQVGLVENYRAQFNKIIAREGIDGLLGRMSKKRDQLEKGLATPAAQ